MIETSFIGTPDGVVIRHVGSDSEWRLNGDGSWARRIDHHGPWMWLAVPTVEVPVSVLHALQDLRAALKPDTATAQTEGEKR